jgi:FLVCR family feline leukemia virus subgroup C receptor-related protein
MTNFSNKWFGSDERVRAVTLIITLNALGYAIGFIFPSFFVANYDDLYQFQNGILMLFIAQSVLVGIQVLICIIVFKDKPEYPPSPAALK